jgi:hypothetical protein
MVGSADLALVGIGVNVAAAASGVGFAGNEGVGAVTLVASTTGVVGVASVAVGVGSVCWQLTARKTIRAAKNSNFIFIVCIHLLLIRQVSVLYRMILRCHFSEVKKNKYGPIGGQTVRGKRLTKPLIFNMECNNL